MVVDDSAVIRGIWARIVDAEPDLRVVAAAGNGRAAVDVLRRREVDVVVLDIEMPEMGGLEALPAPAGRAPLGARGHGQLSHASGRRGDGRRALAGRRGLRHQAVRGGSRRHGRGGPGPGPEDPRAGRTRASPPPDSPGRPRRPRSRTSRSRAGDRSPGPSRRSRVASSTGGPNALSPVLEALPRDFPLPILIVQHMPPLFTTMLAERLAARGRPALREASTARPWCRTASPTSRRATTTWWCASDGRAPLCSR